MIVSQSPARATEDRIDSVVFAGLFMFADGFSNNEINRREGDSK